MVYEALWEAHRSPQMPCPLPLSSKPHFWVLPARNDDLVARTAIRYAVCSIPICVSLSPGDSGRRYLELVKMPILYRVIEL